MADTAVAEPQVAANIAAADHLLAATKAAPEPAAVPAATDTPAETPAAEAAAVPEPARKDAPVEAKPPEKYELTLPADSPLNLDLVTAQAKALDLTNEQAQRYAQQQHEIVANAAAEIHRQYAEVKNDAVLGGAHFEQTLKQVHVGMTYLFGDDRAAAEDVFTRFGLANNPVLVKALAKLGKARSEDTPITAGRAESAAKRRPEDVLYGKPSA